jgi:2-keto-4-pentenoate hydratase/2-oxohepta-3-ene-1,7-dioic acid hydratase in catechol pathway
MKLLNHHGRMTLLAEDRRGVDINRASGGALPVSPAAALERWPEVTSWAAQYDGPADVEIEDALIGAPSPRPRQVVAVGLNYTAHAEEAGIAPPEHPMIFPKLHAAVAGPYDDVAISTGSVDWEVELAVILGRAARRVSAADAWHYVAGFTVSQDISERDIQLRPPGQPQFSLGKSLPGFAPLGPMLVTIDEFADPNDLELVCSVNGEEVQRARTSDLIFSVPELIEYMTDVTQLYPGDVILTGTPSGIGATRTPPRFLTPGDVLESSIIGIGTMRNAFTSGRSDGRAAVGLAHQGA